MKKLLCIFSFALIFNIGNAQDIIIKRNGDEIESKVVEITTNEIKYKNFDHLDGPVRSILKADVFMIKYENGKKELFKEEVPATNEDAGNNQEIKEKTEAIQKTKLETKENTEIDNASLEILPKNRIRKGHLFVAAFFTRSRYSNIVVSKGFQIHGELPISKAKEGKKKSLNIGVGYGYIFFESNNYNYYYYAKNYFDLYTNWRIKTGRLDLFLKGGLSFIHTFQKAYSTDSYYSDTYNTLGFYGGIDTRILFSEKYGYGITIGVGNYIAIRGSSMFFFSLGISLF